MTSEQAETISINSENENITPNPYIKDYHIILKLLKSKDELTYEYALQKTVYLIESLFGGRDDIKKDSHTRTFVLEVARCLSESQLYHYGDSSARLELILRAMASVLHMLLQCDITKIGRDVRAPLYKSLSTFWIIYRSTESINANTMFALREIRTCLRMIRDDQPPSHIVFQRVPEFINVFVNVMEKQYWAAFISLTRVLDFEYTAGKWFSEWDEKHQEYFKLCQKYNTSEPKDTNEIRGFYIELYRSSVKEFLKVTKKNTTFRNFEYKTLKSGGSLAGFSLPDHIDTLLLGYLDLIQRLLIEFFIPLNDQIENTVNFCELIVESAVKKQLTFKSMEILYLIKKSDKGFKDRIERKFKFWSKYYTINNVISIPENLPPQLSQLEEIPITSDPFSSKNKSPLKITPVPYSYSIPSEFNQTPVPDTPASAYSSSFTMQSQSHQTQNRRRKLNVQKTISYLTDIQKFRQEHLIKTYEDIANDVKKLFKQRRSIDKSIKAIEEEFFKSSKSSNDDIDRIVSELTKTIKAQKIKEEEKREERKKIKEEKRKERERIRKDSGGKKSDVSSESWHDVTVGNAIPFPDYHQYIENYSTEKKDGIINVSNDTKVTEGDNSNKNDLGLPEDDLSEKEPLEKDGIINVSNDTKVTEGDNSNKNDLGLPEDDLSKKEPLEKDGIVNVSNDTKVTEGDNSNKNDLGLPEDGLSEKEPLEKDGIINVSNDTKVTEGDNSNKNDLGLPEDGLSEKEPLEKNGIINVSNNTKLPEDGAYVENKDNLDKGKKEQIEEDRNDSHDEKPLEGIAYAETEENIEKNNDIDHPKNDLGEKEQLEEDRTNSNVETIQEMKTNLIEKLNSIQPTSEKEKYLLKAFKALDDNLDKQCEKESKDIHDEKLPNKKFGTNKIINVQGPHLVSTPKIVVATTNSSVETIRVMQADFAEKVSSIQQPKNKEEEIYWISVLRKFTDGVEYIMKRAAKGHQDAIDQQNNYLSVYSSKTNNASSTSINSVKSLNTILTR